MQIPNRSGHMKSFARHLVDEFKGLDELERALGQDSSLRLKQKELIRELAAAGADFWYAWQPPSFRCFSLVASRGGSGACIGGIRHGVFPPLNRLDFDPQTLTLAPDLLQDPVPGSKLSNIEHVVVAKPLAAVVWRTFRVMSIDPRTVRLAALCCAAETRETRKHNGQQKSLRN